MKHKKTPIIHHKHVDKKLKFRLQLYFAISLILLGVIGYDIVKGYIGILLAGACILVGVVIGIFTSRMFHISWDHDAQKVMARIDTFGVVILVGYIIFSILRKKVLAFFIHGPAVGAGSFALLGGVMFGRVLGTRGKILQVLEEQLL